MKQNSTVKQGARQDWLPELTIGLVAVVFCRLWNALFGELYVASNSKQIVFAVMGALMLAKAAYGVRRADAWSKSMCGVLIVFGALMLLVDCISIANP
ncbi:hypothetical protein [Burkholderia gladioli]|uniref:hypothetical protein n=1 Tax=Burkholderia gladioli TaxID=28095 RepID=UPI0005C785B3|nr:hypothetical protein [Burkholderia gladioli]